MIWECWRWDESEIGEDTGGTAIRLLMGKDEWMDG